MKMRVLRIAAAMLSLLFHPDLALAQQAAIAGAVTGAITGTVIGGPLGGVIGAAAGAVVGGAAQANLRPSSTLARLGHRILLSSWRDVSFREIPAHVALHPELLRAAL